MLMKLIDKSALVAEMNKLKNKSLEYGYTTEQRVIANVGKDLTLKRLLDYIDTLEVKDAQEEPVSDDLEEVSKKYSSCIYLEEVLSDDDKEVLRGRLINTFKAGAEWQKSQGVTKEAVIGITPKEYFISISQSTVDMLDLCAGDKVIVQLRKKEDKI